MWSERNAAPRGSREGAEIATWAYRFCGVVQTRQQQVSYFPHGEQTSSTVLQNVANYYLVFPDEARVFALEAYMVSHVPDSAGIVFTNASHSPIRFAIVPSSEIDHLSGSAPAPAGTNDTTWREANERAYVMHSAFVRRLSSYGSVNTPRKSPQCAVGR